MLIKAFDLELTAEEWTKQPCCFVSAAEIKRAIAMGVPPSEAITQRPAEGSRKSRFRGVSWHSVNKHWIAQIKIDGKVKFIGAFGDDDVAAAEAFDAVAKPLGRVTNFK